MAAPFQVELGLPLFLLAGLPEGKYVEKEGEGNDSEYKVLVKYSESTRVPTYP
jgi:hypothetical protein